MWFLSRLALKSSPEFYQNIILLIPIKMFKIKTKPCWQYISKAWQNSPRLYSAFYFLDLEPGCQLIAFYGALVSLIKICWTYYLVYRSDTRSLFPDPKLVYFVLKDIKYELVYHYTHYQFHVGVYLMTLLNSVLLFLGVKWAHVVFLYYWIYISLLTWTIGHCNALLDNLDFSQIFLFSIPTFMLQYYLLIIIMSLIWKIGEKTNASVQEKEESDLQLVE